MIKDPPIKACCRISLAYISRSNGSTLPQLKKSWFSSGFLYPIKASHGQPPSEIDQSALQLVRLTSFNFTIFCWCPTNNTWNRCVHKSTSFVWSQQTSFDIRSWLELRMRFGSLTYSTMSIWNCYIRSKKCRNFYINVNLQTICVTNINNVTTITLRKLSFTRVCIVLEQRLLFLTEWSATFLLRLIYFY